MEIYEEVLPSEPEGTNHTSKGEITSKMQMTSSELDLSIPSIGNQKSVSDQGRSSNSLDTDQFKVKQWSFEEIYAAFKSDMENGQEDMVMGDGGFEDGVDGGPDLLQQGSFNMEEICAEMAQSFDAQVQAYLMSTTQQQSGSSGVITADQPTTMENFLGMTPNLVQGVFTGKEFSAFETSHMPINRGGPIMDPIKFPNGSYQTIGHGMVYPNVCVGMPLVPLPNQAQAGMTVTIPNSSNGMTSIAHASLLDTGDNVVMNKRSKRRRRAHDVEFIENNMDKQMKRMIKNRESAARSRAKKQVHIMELETQLEKLKEENKRLQTEELAVEKAMKQLKVKITNKKSSCAMHQRRNTCMW
ncbi:hypothetical protein QOZ80_2BG0185090 [Eleusine coracana subsp. coracana]|nr:hypothetical protein QOZ80_2BG0185090 [Eleusine coracana subsp. coracana]